MHPLIPMPNPEIGAARLAAGVTFAVAGDPVAGELASSIGGRIVAVRDENRAAYHAAACIASNHVVALMGQVERVAADIGLGLDVFLGLARAALADVEALGPSAALTGPAARGDLATLARHRARRSLQMNGRVTTQVRLSRAGSPKAMSWGLGLPGLGSPGPGSPETGLPRWLTSRSLWRWRDDALDPYGLGIRRSHQAARGSGASVGLVPTMGALHGSTGLS